MSQAAQLADERRHGWEQKAKCRDTDDQLFIGGAAQNRAATFCRGCPVRTDCLVEALDLRIPHGVWGGETERTRRALLKEYPEITSWRIFVEAATVPTIPNQRRSV